jgi:divalent metal cation (Fe/Co/Zn/Cd) transporter
MEAGHAQRTRAAVGGRDALLASSLALAWTTVAWSLLEGGFGLAAAVGASSVALLGFGLDSVVEAASGAIIVWRSRVERRDPHAHARVERVEERAGRLVAVLLLVLALYILVDASHALVARERPKASLPGIVLAAMTMVMMQWLGRRKREVAHALGSRAMAGDAFQATACFYLSAIVLVGTGLNALLGWWWADPAAALLMVVPLLQESRKSWQGDDCE